MARTILVVDDEFDAQKLLNLILTRAGFRVTAAANGSEALAQIERNIPDLIILDVMMPGMDGYEVLRQLRANIKWSHIPVIMLSAKGEVQDRVMGLRQGADDYVTKPADPSELVARVEAVLARSQRAIPVQHGRVIAFMGAKGGVGTTTVAINVGAALSQFYQVTLAELRRGLGSAAAYLGLRPSHTLGDLVMEEDPDETAVQSALIRHACGLRLLAAPGDVPDLPARDASFAESLLEKLARFTQFVLLDLAVDSTFIHPLLPKAETVVLITNADSISVSSTRTLISFVATLGLVGERCRVVLVNRMTGTGVGITALANSLRHPVQAAIPYAAEACIACAEEGIPLILRRPNDLASMALVELAGRLAGIELSAVSELHTIPPGPGEAPREPARSLFSRVGRSG